jgi:hypothetical protein
MAEGLDAAALADQTPLQLRMKKIEKANDGGRRRRRIQGWTVL